MISTRSTFALARGASAPVSHNVAIIKRRMIDPPAESMPENAAQGDRPSTQILQGLGAVEGNSLADPIMHVHACYDIVLVDRHNFSWLRRPLASRRAPASAMVLRAANCYIYEQGEAILIRIRAFVFLLIASASAPP